MNIHLDQFPSIRVAVIGDVMLDCYMSGEVSRISPEAPVPVMRVLSEKSVPGGAANVAANLAALDVRTSLVGLVGQDAIREDLLRCLEIVGEVDCSGLVATDDRRTTRKLRVIGAHQQIVRVDHEDIVALTPRVEQRLIAAARDAIDRTDIVLVSDYGKGVCSPGLLRAVIDHCNAAGKKVLVDPKRRDFAAYRGATILTPNRKELSDATQHPCETDEQAAAASARAHEATGADILLTRSEKGMSFFPRQGTPIHLPTVAQDVFDVSGAGDTVVAVLAAALAAGTPVTEAMRMANHAAGIVVSKLGTATVSRDELAATQLSDGGGSDIADGRLLSLEDAAALRRRWEAEKLTVGFTNGCFDLLHPGHVSLLAQASANCDRLIVALNADTSVRRLKGSTRPIQDERARAAVMGAIKGVAAVILFSEDTPREVIEALQPDLLVKGSDYSEDQVVGADIVKARGGRVLLSSFADGHSTSSLIARSGPPARQEVAR
ncbi:D-beta-D-heptose 7-phosphate kinase/D-beta-D-heptose 1-phosphate adenosyltransferase [Sphingomonas zeicaulis]|uniref:D-glycero-beta-D-manno-heptose-7-phosphate kinase n=1 Tax=Sphingomonas zeicaulis TaxID=1632740 RepID=UPI003D19004D